MKTRFSLTTATALVIANMVGTGVFTSLGFQVAAFKSPSVLLALWVVRRGRGSREGSVGD